MSCTCKTCFGHGVCGDSLLFVSLFDPSIEVPSGYVGATVSNRKKCKSIGGLAGRKRWRHIQEKADDEKTIHSKAAFLKETAQRPERSPRDSRVAIAEGLAARSGEWHHLA